MSIKFFLESLNHVPKKKLLKIVVGNQSADMDSVVSAITYAYFHHKRNPKEEPFFPLVNISRDEFRLRKDIVLLLNNYEISSACLFFLDDVEAFLKESPYGKLNVILVDHCNLQGELLTELFEKRRLTVTGIIDHHADEGVFTEVKPRLIQSNGSCSALVFNYWNSQIGPILDKEVVSLLLGPLLIDTSNMTQKVEEEDRKAYGEYGKVLEVVSSVQTNVSEPFTDVYAELKEAKKDLSGFSLFDILRKDYKQFKFIQRSGTSVNVGFASISKSLSWVLSKFTVSELVKSLKEMKDVFHLDAVIITSSYTPKKTRIFTREFCFSTQNTDLANLDFLVQELELSKEFHEKDAVSETLGQINNYVPFRVFNQQNTAASRKQIVPVIKEVIEQRL